MFGLLSEFSCNTLPNSNGYTGYNGDSAESERLLTEWKLTDVFWQNHLRVHHFALFIILPSIMLPRIRNGKLCCVLGVKADVVHGKVACPMSRSAWTGSDY